MWSDNEDAIYESSALHPLDEEAMMTRPTKKLRALKKRKEVRRTLLEDLTDAVGAYYSRDPSSPGVVISRLSDGRYYVSVVRYERAYGKKKKVICSALAYDLRSAIVNCATKWQSEVARIQVELSRLGKTVRAMSEGVR